MYDKAGCILRIETTMGNNSDFKVPCPRHASPDGKLEWQLLRKGVTAIHRSAEVSQTSRRLVDAEDIVVE